VKYGCPDLSSLGHHLDSDQERQALALQNFCSSIAVTVVRETGADDALCVIALPLPQRFSLQAVATQRFSSAFVFWQRLVLAAALALDDRSRPLCGTQAKSMRHSHARYAKSEIRSPSIVAVYHFRNTRTNNQPFLFSIERKIYEKKGRVSQKDKFSANLFGGTSRHDQSRK
jgi:hypothetical protein